MSDEKPLIISWTALRIHEECRHKGMLQRSGVRAPMQDNRNFFHGTVADRIVRRWLEDPERQPGTMAAQVEATFEAETAVLAERDQGYVRWKNRTDRADAMAKVQDLVVKIEPWLEVHILPYEFEPEVRFRFPIAMEGIHGPVQVLMVGGIDLLKRDEHGDWHVWDLKATANPDYWKSTLGQLVFYCLAVQMGFEPHKLPTVAGIVQPLVSGAFEKRFEFTDDDYGIMWSRMTKMLHDIQRKKFEYKDGTSGCNWCEVRHACSRFNPVKAFNRPPRTDHE